MEGEPATASTKASREASEWFVFLQDDPGDRALRRRFDAWLGASAENAAAWAETLRTASLAEALLPFDARDWSVPPTRLPAEPVDRPPARRLRRWGPPLGAVVAAACLLVFFAPAAILRLQSDYATGTAEMRDVTLEDGSVVTLAPDSAIAVAYSAAAREVRLLAGEAFFSVTPNARRPFRVAARNVEAAVLGTSFDVHLDSRAVGVSVRHGKVRVATAGHAEVLEAGQAVRVASAGGALQRTTLSPQTVGSWRGGQLVMEEGLLGDVAGQLDRYFDGTIILAEESLRDRPVTGVFDLHDPQGALRAMAKALDLRVRQVTPWLLIVSSR